MGDTARDWDWETVEEVGNDLDPDVGIELDLGMLKTAVPENECVVQNKTLAIIKLVQYCNSTEWNEIKDDSGFPLDSTAGYDNSSFNNVYTFCENVNQPMVKVLTPILKVVILVSIWFLMMGLGVTMEPAKIIKFAKRPVGATIATLVQFAVMPFVAYGLSLAFKMNEIKTLTMVILGCCPGGTLSNFMALLLRGDMNLSILMTSVSTIVGVGAIPGMIKLLSSFFLDDCTDLVINSMDIIKPLALTLLPCGIGMAIKKWSSEKVCNIVLLVGKVAMVGGLIGIVGVNVAIYRSTLVTRFPLDIIVAIALIPVSGFVFGFFSAWAAQEPPRSRRTIMLETGLKNGQICLAIMMVTLPMEKMGVLMMMPIYFVLFQLIESAVLAFIFTKILQTQDEDEQEKMLEYASPVEKAPLQRDFSKRFAKKTHTPVGSYSNTNSFENLIVGENGSTNRTNSISITCNNCGHFAGTLKSAKFEPSVHPSVSE